MRQGKTRRDLLIAFASQFAFKILGFALLALMARRLSQADYGKLMFALTLCGVTVLGTDLGASTDLSRRVAAEPGGARRRLEAVLSARLPLVAAYLVLLPAWVAITKPDALGVAAAIAGRRLSHRRLPDLRRRVVDRRRLPERGPPPADGHGTGTALETAIALRDD